MSVRMNEIEKCYRVLELKPGATLEEVNQAYKDLAFIWHPDRIPKDNPRLIEKAVAKLQEINNARDQLRSIGRKATQNGYSRQPSAQPSPPQRSSEPPKRPYYRETTYDPGFYRQARSTSYQEANPNSKQTKSTSYQEANPNSKQTKSTSYQEANPNSKQTKSTSYQEKKVDPGSKQTKSSSYQEQTVPSSRQAQSAYRDNYTQPPASNGHEVKKPYYSDLSGVDLQGANLKEKDLSGRNLSNADLRGADLSDSFLHKVVLKEADLSGANLFRANLLQADLRGANLQATNLIGADLSGADLSGANLKGAKIGSGDRIMVKLTGANLYGAILPDGSLYD